MATKFLIPLAMLAISTFFFEVQAAPTSLASRSAEVEAATTEFAVLEGSTSTAIDTLTETEHGRVKRQGGGCGCCGCGCCGCGGGGGGCGCCCCRPKCCCCCRKCCTCCRTCCCTRCCTCCRPCCCGCGCGCCGCGGGGRKRRSLQALAIKLADKKSQEVPAMPAIEASVTEVDAPVNSAGTPIDAPTQEVAPVTNEAKSEKKNDMFL